MDEWLSLRDIKTEVITTLKNNLDQGDYLSDDNRSVSMK